MMYGMCSGCLCDAHFTEVGHDEHGRIFKLYFCHKCKNYTRVFEAPLAKALVTDAHSASRIRARNAVKSRSPETTKHYRRFRLI